MPGTMSPKTPLGLFEAYGVEIEYMIVDRDTLEIRPWADKLLAGPDNVAHNDMTHGEITWCNELARHLIEMNFTDPEKNLYGKAGSFHRNVLHANSILEKSNGMLLPGAMHPFVNPRSRKVELWPFGDNEIYRAYDKIFQCDSHGWVNVQSVHLNLPFNGDGEFRKLHGAIRFILPIIPALAASSPIAEGQIGAMADMRLRYYRLNQEKIPEISGGIIPEIVNSIEEYVSIILGPMYRAISPFDPEGILQHEWLNSRGAIARFDRSAIEIRVIDPQECPLADMAVVEVISRLLKWLVCGRPDRLETCHNFDQNTLIEIFNRCISDGDEALVEDAGYLQIFNLAGQTAAKEIWMSLFDRLFTENDKLLYKDFIEEYAANGTLSKRILKVVGPRPGEESILKVYRELAVALAENKVFKAG